MELKKKEKKNTPGGVTRDTQKDVKDFGFS